MLMLKPAVVLSLVFLAQAGVFYGFSRGESAPPRRAFDSFPAQLGTWKLAQQGVIEDEIKGILRADDYISRVYEDCAGGSWRKPDQPSAGCNSSSRIADLFVAYFNSQRSGQSPHSPKNCLPGSGWVWSVSDEISIDIPGRAAPIRVNRYIVSKGDAKDVVLYWYQSRDRVVASEYKATVYVVADALRYNRTDTSLVRVTVPVQNNQEEAATASAVEFVKTMFGTLRSYLPS
jgi:EpsI family protein